MKLSRIGYWDEAEHMQRRTGLSYLVCTQLLSARRRGDCLRLALEAGKHLVTSEQKEGLKSRCLTVFDAITGNYEIYDSGFVETMLVQWNERLGTSVFALETWDR